MEDARITKEGLVFHDNHFFEDHHMYEIYVEYPGEQKYQDLKEYL